jgi:hypothetical protein
VSHRDRRTHRSSPGRDGTELTRDTPRLTLSGRIFERFAAGLLIIPKASHPSSVRTGFQIEQTIVLVADGLQLDLHNCYDFEGYEHRPSARTARFEWHRISEDRVSKELPARIILIFEGVTNLTVRKRDDEMPFTEDACLAGLNFLPPDLIDEFDAFLPAYRSADEHATLSFQSGAAIKVWADSISHEFHS